MARYSYQCPVHGEFDAFYTMGEAPSEKLCDYLGTLTWVHNLTRVGVSAPVQCMETAKRVYSFYHQEDRRHMRAGISPATGKPFAQSRDEERAIEKASGIYFAGKNDLLPHEREALAYREHVVTGGERVENPVTVPEEPSKPLTSYMREMNYRRHEFAPETFTPEHQERQFKELVAKAESA